MFFVFFLKQQAAATPIFCAVSRDLDNVDGGIYWNSLYPCKPSIEAQDTVLAYRIWEISEALLINKTQSFDNLLSTGDKFSSVTALTMPNDEDELNISFSKISTNDDDTVIIDVNNIDDTVTTM